MRSLKETVRAALREAKLIKEAADDAAEDEGFESGAGGIKQKVKRMAQLDQENKYQAYNKMKEKIDAGNDPLEQAQAIAVEILNMADNNPAMVDDIFKKLRTELPKIVKASAQAGEKKSGGDSGSTDSFL